MFENVLIGVDGGDGGRDAIALARRLGGRRARYVLMNVVSRPAVGSGGGALWLAACRRYAEEMLERERSETGIDATLATDCGRSPARALHDRALREGSDLIVVGASHRSRFLRALLGDDAVATVGGSPCAIAIAPPEHRRGQGRWTTIAVGDDGSAQSSRGLDVAREVSSADHATIEAVPMMGDAVDVLTDLSAEVDLLVIATCGQGRLGRWINGSTARCLAARTRCPLLILPSSRHAASAI